MPSPLIVAINLSKIWIYDDMSRREGLSTNYGLDMLDKFDQLSLKSSYIMGEKALKAYNVSLSRQKSSGENQISLN